MKCKKTLENGEQCRANALKGKKYCFSHDPESKDAKLEAVRKGGQFKDITIDEPLEEVRVVNQKDVVTLLTKTIQEVRNGILDPRIANTIGYLAGHLIKAFEMADITKRIEELEKAIEEKTG